MVFVCRNRARAETRMWTYVVACPFFELLLMDLFGPFLLFAVPVVLLLFLRTSAWWDDRIVRGLYVFAWLPSLAVQLALPHMFSYTRGIWLPDVTTFLTWIVAPSMLLYPFSSWLAIGYLNTLRQFRSVNGCERCGYDLTGNISGRCPECGKPIQLNGEEESPVSDVTPE